MTKETSNLIHSVINHVNRSLETTGVFKKQTKTDNNYKRTIIDHFVFRYELEFEMLPDLDTISEFIYYAELYNIL